MRDHTECCERCSPWFLATAMLFVTCLITANIIAVKLINVFGSVLPAAVIIFPISYIIGDVLTEVYGFARAKQVIWLGFLCNLVSTLAIWSAQKMPGAVFWDGQAAYERILGYTPRILIASLAGYLVGGFSNSIILARMKVLTRGRWLWMRTIGSTIVGEGLDSLVFITIAFYGTAPVSQLISSIVAQWLFKTLYESVITPATYAVVAFLKKQEGIDVFDSDTDFNPLRFAANK